MLLQYFQHQHGTVLQDCDDKGVAAAGQSCPSSHVAQRGPPWIQRHLDLPAGAAQRPAHARCPARGLLTVVCEEAGGGVGLQQELDSGHPRAVCGQACMHAAVCWIVQPQSECAEQAPSATATPMGLMRAAAMRRRRLVWVLLRVLRGGRTLFNQLDRLSFWSLPYKPGLVG